MKRLSALEVRKKFGSVLDLVAQQRVPVTITRGGKPLVVMISADEYQAMKGGRQAQLGLAIERVSEWRARHARRLRGVNVVRLVRESRNER